MPNNKNMIQKLSNAFAALSEEILRRNPPYDDIPIKKEVASTLYLKLIEYQNELEETFREKILNSIIVESKWYILFRSLPNIEQFGRKYPEHVEIQEKFERWLKSKSGSSPDYHPSKNVENKIQENKLIKKIVEYRMPEFKYNSKKSSSTDYLFFFDWTNEYMVYLSVDKGSRRDFLSFFLGLSSLKLKNKVRYHIDISSFFGGVQSVFPYTSSHELQDSLNDALSLIEKLLPHYLNRLQNTLY